MDDIPPVSPNSPVTDDPVHDIRARLRDFLLQRKKPIWLVRLGYILLALLISPALFGAGMWLQYELFARPRALVTAGPIALTRMSTDVSADTIIPKPTDPENGAFHYVLAINSYNARRAPYLASRGLKPIADEPPANLQDLRDLALGGSNRRCDFYEVQNGQPRFVFYIIPGGTKWAFRPGEDPLEIRPYVGPIRVLAQAALNWGKNREIMGQKSDAERIYQVAAQLGIHLRDNPGTLLDIELGLEIEQNALHYLENLYGGAGNTKKQRTTVDYAASVARLHTAVRAKYAQLDSVEAAMEVLAADEEPVWRVLAASALVHARHYRGFGWPRSFVISRSLDAGLHDRNAFVGQAMKHLLSLKESDFRISDAPTGPVE
jgi:hypothetical protein